MTDFPQTQNVLTLGVKENSSSLETPHPLPNDQKRKEDDFFGIDLSASQLASSIFQLLEPEIPSNDLHFANQPNINALHAAKIEQINKKSQQDNLNTNVVDTLSDQATQLQIKLKKLRNDIDVLEKYFNTWDSTFSDYGNMQRNLLSILEYFNINQDNFLTSLSFLLKPEYSKKLDGALDQTDIGIKLTNCAAPFLFNATKFYILYTIKRNLSSFHTRFEDLKPLMSSSATNKTNIELINSIIKIAESLNKKVEINREEALKKSKIEKIAGKLSAIPLWHYGKVNFKTANKASKSTFAIIAKCVDIYEFRKSYSIQNKMVFHLQSRLVVNANYSKATQEKLYDEVELFLADLKKCTTKKEAEKKLQEISVKIDFPYDFDDWIALQKTQRFRRFITQSYFYTIQKRPFMDSGHINDLLQRRSNERGQKIHLTIPFIMKEIQQTQNLNFPELKAYFKEKLHIHFDQISLPQNTFLENKEHWNHLIQDQNFCYALSAQWVDYQETNAQLIAQATRQFLLSKSSVEKNFLLFRIHACFASILFSLLQLFILVPQVKAWLIVTAIEFCINDLAKNGFPSIGSLNLFHPLYPDMNFKIDSMLMLFLEKCLGSNYKPNEYSLEGYKLTIQIRWFALVRTTYYVIALLEQMLLFLNIRIIKNCILRKEKKPLEEDIRYIQIDEKLKQNDLNFRTHIKELNTSLDKLKLEDLKLLFIPHSKKENNKDLPEEKNKNLQEEKNRDFKPLEFFFEALRNSNVQYFPKEVHELFEEMTGCKLTESNKANLEEKLKAFFLLSEDKFFNTYQENYTNYLRKPGFVI